MITGQNIDEAWYEDPCIVVEYKDGGFKKFEYPHHLNSWQLKEKGTIVDSKFDPLWFRLQEIRLRLTRFPFP